MRNKLAIIFGTPIAIALILVWFFYDQQLKGVWPAILPPTENIVELIEKVEGENSQKDELELPEFRLTARHVQPPPAKDIKPSSSGRLKVKQPKKTAFPLVFRNPNLQSYYFSISVFADELNKVRDLEELPNGTVLASITDEGKVLALIDHDRNGDADEVITLLKDLNSPHGLATQCNLDLCKIYVAESDQISVYEFHPEELHLLSEKHLVDLPNEGRHYTRTILFRPPPHDDELFVSIGSSCDTCHEDDEKRAAIWTLNVDTGEFKPFAKGLRNSVFMANHPKTDKLWATEMGRDLLGDDLPPDEINIVEEGGNYGWPICYGRNVHDTVFDKNTYIRNPCQDPFETPSYIDIPAHSSPLGLAFFPEKGWPEAIQNDLLVAYHGSWNRSEPTGYEIVYYEFGDEGQLIRRKPFLTGWLTHEGKSLGRPVDILIRPDGTILISDDKAGVIYRVSYEYSDDAIERIFEYTLSEANKSDKINLDNFPSYSIISTSETLSITGLADSSLVWDPHWNQLTARLYDQNGDLFTPGKNFYSGYGAFVDDVEYHPEEGALNKFLFEIPFLEQKLPPTNQGTLVLGFNLHPNSQKHHNFYIPVEFDMSLPPDTSKNECIVSGCAFSHCSRIVVSACKEPMKYNLQCCIEYLECELQEDAECGWTVLEGYGECTIGCDY